MRIYLSQTNPLIGDLDQNFNIIEKEYLRANDSVCDLIVFSELNLTGYPPEDLLQKKYFIEAVLQKIQQICALTAKKKCAALLGAPIYEGELLFNAVLLVENGEIIKKFFKKELPNYGVFDEKRYFSACENFESVDFRGFKLVSPICEDVWNEENIEAISKINPDLIINLNASPFSKNKYQKRIEVAKNFAKGVATPLIYVNQVGGADSIIFDGKSFVLDKKGNIALEMKGFCQDYRMVEVVRVDGEIKINCQDNCEIVKSVQNDVYSAVLIGLRDYVKKTGFSKVILGMSGGIDSALVAAIAVDALGSENVRLVALPSRYNSQQSLDDAFECAKNLGIKLEVIEIENVFNAILDSLSEKFTDVKSDLTEENMQSRIRGVILMAMSNKFGNLLISTGNKSEMAVGYATIYGDMCGAYNPLKDIYKTEVFALSKWRNKNIPEISVYKKTDLIPRSIIEKPPTAELRFDQKDSDSLPEYDILDQILYKIIEEEKSVEQVISETNFDENLVKKVAKLFYLSEYKRKQAVIGAKVSEMSFDKDRRYLISNKFWL